MTSATWLIPADIRAAASLTISSVSSIMTNLHVTVYQDRCIHVKPECTCLSSEYCGCSHWAAFMSAILRHVYCNIVTLLRSQLPSCLKCNKSNINRILRSTEMYTWLVRRLVISQYCGMYTAILSPCFCYSCFVHIRNIVVNRDSDVHSMYTRHQKFVMYHLPLMYRRSARSWLSNTTAARQSPPTWVGGWGTAS